MSKEPQKIPRHHTRGLHYRKCTHIRTFESSRKDKIEKIEMGRIDKCEADIKTYNHGGFTKLVFEDTNPDTE